MAKCNACGREGEELMLMVVVGYSCYKCDEPITICATSIGEGQIISSWDDLPQEVVKLAEGLGIRLKHAYSREAGGSYLWQVCPHCGALQGDWYIGQYVDMHGGLGYPTGLVVCPECGELLGALEDAK